MVGDKMVFGKSVHEPSPEFDYPTFFKDALDHPAARELLDIWRGHEAQGGMRMGRDIPSRKLGRFLANIVIVEPIGDWEDTRVRLAGQVLMLRFGKDVTGQLGSEVFSENLRGHRLLCDLAREAVKTRKPYFLDSRVMRGGEELMHAESLNVPIFGPNGEQGWMMGALFLFDQK